MKRALITGATGFVGANLARRLLEEGWEVHALVRPGYHAWRLADVRDDLHLHEALMHDPAAVRKVVQECRPRWVFHLAVHGAYSWERDLGEMIRTNLSGLAALLTACVEAGVESFVNTGSSSEYGAKDHAPREDETLDPNSHYAITKAAATHYCRLAAQDGRMHLPTLRLYSVFGPYEDPRRLLPTLIAAGLEGKLPPLANPEIARDFVYVDDVVDVCLLAAEKGTTERGPIYNIGTGVESKLKDVVAAARRLMSIREEPAWDSMPGREWDTTVWVADNRKARETLGWSPRYSFDEGFARMLAWQRERSLRTVTA